MKINKIGLILEEISKKYNINYISINHKNLQAYKDAIKLREIYRILHEVLGDLQEIEERHRIDGLGKIIADSIYKLSEIDHDIIKLATKLGENENT